MSVGRRIGTAVVMATLVILATPSMVHADLSISVPTSTIPLGTVPTGTLSISQQLGTVKVTASGLVFPSFTATVSTTTFTTGSATPNETIGKASIRYWSGPTTATTGAQTAVPGQPTALNAMNLSIPLVAFRSTGLALSISTSWNPTIIVTIPAAAVAGSYTGTITHSVA